MLCLLNWCPYLLRRVFRTFSHEGLEHHSISRQKSQLPKLLIFKPITPSTGSISAFYLRRCWFSFLRLSSQHSQRFQNDTSPWLMTLLVVNSITIIWEKRLETVTCRKQHCSIISKSWQLTPTKKVHSYWWTVKFFKSRPVATKLHMDCL